MDTIWKESSFYANKLPRKRTTLSYVYKWFGVISPIKLDYKINLNLCYMSISI